MAAEEQVFCLYTVNAITERHLESECLQNKPLREHSVSKTFDNRRISPSGVAYERGKFF